MSRKLMLLVGVNCLAAVLMLVAGTLGLQGVNQRARHISQDNLASLEVLGSIAATTQQVQTDVASLAISSGPVALAFFQDRIASADSTIDTQLAAYRRTIRTPDQARAAERFEIWWDAYQRFRTHRLVPLASGDAVTFQQAYLGQGQIVADKAMAALSELSRYEQESGLRATREAESTYHQALVAMGIALAVGLVLALALATQLTRLVHVTRPEVGYRGRRVAG